MGKFKFYKESDPEVGLLIKTLKNDKHPDINITVVKVAAGYYFARFKEKFGISGHWELKKKEIKILMHALTCPKEELPPMAVREMDYDLVYHGRNLLPTAKAVASQIAIARLDGKL